MKREQIKAEFLNSLPSSGYGTFDKLMTQIADLAFEKGWLECAKIVGKVMLDIES